MQTLFLKTRNRAFNKGQWLYTVDYMYNQERAYYVENASVTFDTVPSNLITDVKGRGLTLVTFDETVVSLEDMTYDLQDYRGCRVKTATEAQEFLRANSTLTESPANTFSYSWDWDEDMWIEAGTKSYVIS